MHAPEISTTLIFAHELCTDNDVFFEIHDDCFFVKDKPTKSASQKTNG